ncbi:hypothetical protein CC80DRAFT_117338 [Byssothecium circinans]|uniref:Uncharacterized protein n=1 Tax=Byssothecium circinans TaxID=147558 RepID=A0A6A5U0X4_9PLEO|nr:hypothetical protein CC80DRAFT_117338 [Byssothecium circinans]
MQHYRCSQQDLWASGPGPAFRIFLEPDGLNSKARKVIGTGPTGGGDKPFSLPVILIYVACPPSSRPTSFLVSLSLSPSVVVSPCHSDTTLGKKNGSLPRQLARYGCLQFLNRKGSPSLSLLALSFHSRTRISYRLVLALSSYSLEFEQLDILETRRMRASLSLLAVVGVAKATLALRCIRRRRIVTNPAARFIRRRRIALCPRRRHIVTNRPLRNIRRRRTALCPRRRHIALRPRRRRIAQTSAPGLQFCPATASLLERQAPASSLLFCPSATRVLERKAPASSLQLGASTARVLERQAPAACLQLGAPASSILERQAPASSLLLRPSTARVLERKAPASSLQLGASTARVLKRQAPASSILKREAPASRTHHSRPLPSALHTRTSRTFRPRAFRHQAHPRAIDSRWNHETRPFAAGSVGSRPEPVPGRG